MSDEQQAAFIERSRRLFDCDPTEPVPTVSFEPPVSNSDDSDSSLTLVVGAITSPDTGLVERLLNSLAEKIAGREGVSLRVVLLENGGDDPVSRSALRDSVHRATEQCLHVVLKSLEQQHEDGAAGVLEITSEQPSHRKSIAQSRTMLQRYLFMEAKPLPGAVVWILDDDVMLENLSYGPGKSPEARDVDYVSEIRKLKDSGASIVLCEVTGDPPLPALSCVRTQLVDLYHNLHRFSSLAPESPYPDHGEENRMSRMEHPDYYYDLSSNWTSQLELPFWYEAGGENRTVGEAFREMVTCLPGILSGVQVFRPLVRVERKSAGEGLPASINRGPATLAFDLQALREFPNAVPVSGGMDFRRSDMVWSLLNLHTGGREALQAPLPVRQVRVAEPSDGSIQDGFSTMEQDLVGYAFYSALRNLLEHKIGQHHVNGRVPQGRRYLHFTDAEVSMASRLFQWYLDQRVSSFEISFIRITGLVSALKRLCQIPCVGQQVPWWLEQAEFSGSVENLRGVRCRPGIHLQGRTSRRVKEASCQHRYRVY